MNCCLGKRLTRTLGYSALMTAALSTGLAAVSPAQRKKPEVIIITGRNFQFGVCIPEGWQGDTRHAPYYHADLIFYPRGAGWKSTNPIIRVRLNRKADENTAADLEHDLEEYRKKSPQVQYEGLNVGNMLYRCFAKLVFVEGEFYDYITYINPGSKYWYCFSVLMTGQKARLDDKQLTAYRFVAATLQAMQY